VILFAIFCGVVLLGGERLLVVLVPPRGSQTCLQTTARASSLGMQRVFSAVASNSAKFKLLVAFCQILSSLSANTKVNFPSSFSGTLSIFLSFSLNVIPIFGLPCSVSGFNYISTMVLTTSIPLGVSALLGIAYWSESKLRQCLNWNAPALGRQQAYAFSFLMLTFLVLANTSSILFNYFSCQTFPEAENGPQSYLTSDYSINCSSERYLLYQIYAGVMIFVFPFGIPMMYTTLLWKYRKEFSDSKWKSSVPSLGFLVRSYKAGFFWFEVVECARRLILASVIGILPNSAASAPVTGIIVCQLFNYISVQYKPFKKDDDNNLNIVLSNSLSLIFLATLIIGASTISLENTSQQVFGSILLIVVFFGPFIMVVKCVNNRWLYCNGYPGGGGFYMFRKKIIEMSSMAHAKSDFEIYNQSFKEEHDEEEVEREPRFNFVQSSHSIPFSAGAGSPL
jgi:hypothetical protein